MTPAAGARPAPLLVLGWGNPSRGDDALGPWLVDALAQHAAATLPPGRVECLTDFQLQVEHALDLIGRERVLLVDAALGLDAPFVLRTPQARRDPVPCSHALQPEAVLQVYRTLQGTEPPPCTLLALRARRFGLGETPDAQALADLDQALAWAQGWLRAEAVPAPFAPSEGPSR